MVPLRNIEILISILFALRGVLGENLAGALILGGRAETTAAPDDLSTVSIIDAPGYEVAGGCVRECLMQEFEGVGDGLILAAALGCTSPYYNGCYCTAAVASEASSYISICIIHECSGTAEIPDAFSIYDTYCTTAGYPRNVAATTTAINNPNPQTTTANNITPQTTTVNNANPQTTTVSNANPQITFVTGAVIYTVTVGSSTLTLTEPGVQTVLSTSSAPPSSNSNGGGKKSNVGGIVGGVLGALVLIAVLLGIFFLWRRQKQKALSALEAQPQTQAEPGSASVLGAAAVGVRKAGGRAELQGAEKGAVVGEKEVLGDAKKDAEVAYPAMDRGAEVDGAGIVEAEGRYGLRAEELDSEGRHVGELHGDGRHFGGVELE